MHAWLEYVGAALRRLRNRLFGYRHARRGYSRVENAVAALRGWLLPSLWRTAAFFLRAWQKLDCWGRHHYTAAVALFRVCALSRNGSAEIMRRATALGHRLSSRLRRRRAPLWIAGVHRRGHRIGRRLRVSGDFSSLAYKLYVPTASAAEPLPLLVMLHGCNQDAATFAAGTRMNQLAARRGFAVLYPEQSSRFNALRCWNWFRARHPGGEGEPELIADMIVRVCADHAIEPRRIYVAGMSAGAAMARVLTARHSTLFAACGLHSGVMYRAATSAAQVASTMNHGSAASPKTTALALAAQSASVDVVPTVAIHGAADRVVNPVNLDQLTAQFVALDERVNAEEDSKSRYSEGVSHIDGRACTVREYVRGGRLYLRSYLIEGLGHAWSGGDPAYPFNDGTGPRASELIWDFVSRYQRESRGTTRDASVAAG